MAGAEFKSLLFNTESDAVLGRVEVVTWALACAVWVGCESSGFWLQLLWASRRAQHEKHAD